jgi:hypothetical protein
LSKNCVAEKVDWLVTLCVLPSGLGAKMLARREIYRSHGPRWPVIHRDFSSIKVKSYEIGVGMVFAFLSEKANN